MDLLLQWALRFVWCGNYCRCFGFTGVAQGAASIGEY